MFFELKLPVLIIVLLYADSVFGKKNMQSGCQAFPNKMAKNVYGVIM